jgi:hypothetical protein
MPAYLVGPKTMALDVFRLKCSYDRVAEIAGDCIHSHSTFMRDKAGRGNPALGI